MVYCVSHECNVLVRSSCCCGVFRLCRGAFLCAVAFQCFCPVVSLLWRLSIRYRGWRWFVVPFSVCCSIVWLAVVFFGLLMRFSVCGSVSRFTLIDLHSLQ